MLQNKTTLILAVDTKLFHQVPNYHLYLRIAMTEKFAPNPKAWASLAVFT